MDLLDNVIQPYAWGSRTAIAELLGQPSPSTSCQAELWLGAHPGGPSRVRRGSGEQTLLETIRSAPERELGEVVARRFGQDLPFLLKVLAAETPLSLQTHPSLSQAREGYARENALGVPLGAPHRNYKDANHKPELICALTPFDALCGFRRADETLALFDLLGLGALEPLLAPLRASPDAQGIARLFEALMTSPREQRGPLVGAVVSACAARAGQGGPFAEELRWAVRLGELYPGDPGVIGALLLNLVRLQPGEAIYLSAGNLHAYLHGVGVEIMANSDNVLRGGCTPKHVDVPELLRVLDFRCGPIGKVQAQSSDGVEYVYPTPTEEFRLSRLELRPGVSPRPARRGPEILLCTRGAARLSIGGEVLPLPRGSSVFVSASDGAYTLEGDGVVFRATAGV
ncbi:mannose-6-phosphate isomerase, class I [Vitiosangium sp. GDMCC 1.1324]|uniref:mannose-6-phosphate isomerase, class I n=1 Tax=Vitiosangium sp. (strain GDMCC 1.1324) TaxID=2138576 RepID=UPI000D3494DC|nr:mannose-6-phosphate isomerase, class I [Vitiosangium sp. GDMCC 1.1324]PTL81027.1 mannose-6-phosphate isomerase, class I [Vitiosangium sp. GDMCC 1.1324]